MTDLTNLRQTIRIHTLYDEDALGRQLLELADIGDERRANAQNAAAGFVRAARANATRSGLIDKFLQEYGLSTAEGVTLMRLAEALLRTPDSTTADALIKDKVEAGDWSAHRGKSPFPLVNFSTNALMLTAAWLDDIEAKDPARAMLKATKSLLDRVGEPVIRASVAQAMRIMGEHFVLGETIEEAMKRGESYGRKGYAFSFDMLGEAAHTAEDAEKYFQDYQHAIAAIARFCNHERTADNPGISVKLSALHPRYEYGKKERVRRELGDRLRTLAVQARDANMGFNIDAEEADRLDLSLDLIEALMRDPALADWQGFGVVVQAYQRRATCVLDWLATIARETGRRIMVRLVKGAYWDSEIKRAQVMGLESYPVFTRKTLTDVSYLACARKMLMNTDVFYPQFATHNALTATSVREIAATLFDAPYTDYELQRLHGMGEELHDMFLEDGIASRIYAPVGGHRELLPYLVRRLLENGANSSFVNQLIDPEVSIEEVVASPFEEAQALTQLPNPAIPNPCDLFRDELPNKPRLPARLSARLSARGLDLTDPETASRFSIESRRSLPTLTASPIIGKIQNTDGRQVLTIRNPANHDDVIGSVSVANEEDVTRAVETARNGFHQWSKTPVQERQAILLQAADRLETRMDEFMRLAVFEAGKSWEDAVAEIREAVDFCRYYANQATTLPEQKPAGVIACISPWNFPLAIFLGQIVANLSIGNAVIAKPAEQTPLIAFDAITLLHECGIPTDALVYLPGDGEEVGAPLVSHPGIDGVVFTGSTPVAQSINRSLKAKVNTTGTLIAETGGINAMIIDSTALLEQAVSDVVSSAFQSAGQRCSACRIVCVQSDVYQRFTAMLKGAMAELTVGDPADLFTDVGPVIDSEAQSVILSYLDTLPEQARIIASVDLVDETKNGTFVAPVAIEMPSIAAVTREIFGPVLHVVPFEADALEQTIDAINTLGFGLTLGIHTRIDETMHTIVNRARVGNIYVNRNQIGAVVGVQPFGGEGLSGTGPKAGGPHYLSSLTQHDPKIITPYHGSIRARPMTDEERNTIALADRAFHAWRLELDPNRLLSTACGTMVGTGRTILDNIIDARHETFSRTSELPGPTGESNTLRLRGTGICLVLGCFETAEALADDPQFINATAGGNAVILAGASSACHDLLDGISKSFRGAGVPENLFQRLDEEDISEAMLLDPRIRIVSCSGPQTVRDQIARILSRREGAITPLLNGTQPHRYAVERTLSINTTAAGGDVRLLSLSDV